MTSLDMKKMLQVLVRVRSSEKVGGKLVFESILRLARESGLAGASVWQCIRGFGDHGNYKIDILRMTPDLPLLVEVVDEPAKVAEFLPLLKELVGDRGFITVAPVEQLGPTQGHPDDPNVSMEVSLHQMMTNLAHMARLVAQLPELTDGSDIIARLGLLEENNQELSDQLLQLVGQGLFLPVRQDSFSGLVNQLGHLTEVTTGLSHRLALPLTGMLSPFVAHFRAMTQLLVEASVLLNQLACRFGRDWTESWEDVRTIREVEGRGDSTHRSFIRSLVDGTYEPLQVLFAKDIDQYLEDVLDSYYQCYLALKLVGDEYHQTQTVKRLYLP